MSFQEKFKNVLKERPHAILGKNGVSNEIIAHFLTLLKKYKIIKIKALKSVFSDPNETIDDIARRVSQLTNSDLLDVRGKTFILSVFKEKK